MLNISVTFLCDMCCNGLFLFYLYIQLLVQACQHAPPNKALALFSYFLENVCCALWGGAHSKDPNLCRVFYFEAHDKGTPMSFLPPCHQLLTVSTFFSCASDARQMSFVVHATKKRTAKVLCQAKRCRAAFAVRFREKRTTKALSCIFGPLQCTCNARQSPCFL
jgi:hypothetical protein